jgi:uncharacterized protein
MGGGAALGGVEERIRTALISSLAWAVAETNDETLWAKARETARSALLSYWRRGELKGTRADEAFFVRCGHETMTQDDIDAGRLIVEVGIAPAAPAEFVVFRVSQVVGGRRKPHSLLGRLFRHPAHPA